MILLMHIARIFEETIILIVDTGICLQAASIDEELKARTVHITSFVMWPLNAKGKERKASTDAMKLNKDSDG